MTSREKFRFGFQIFLSVFTGALGFAYILSAANIYYSGPVESGSGMIYYSREIVWSYLRWLLIPTAIWIVAIVAAFVLSVVSPAKRNTRKQSAFETVDRLQKRIPAHAEGELASCLQRVKRREAVRHGVRIVIGVYCLIAAVMCAVYVFNATNFPAENLSGEVLRMLAHVLPWISVAFVLTCGVMIYDFVSAKRVLPDMKKLVAAKGEPAKPCPFLQTTKRAERVVFSAWGLLAIRAVVAVVGITFIAVGIANGGAEDVLAKAVNICTECIGLG